MEDVPVEDVPASAEDAPVVEDVPAEEEDPAEDGPVVEDVPVPAEDVPGEVVPLAPLLLVGGELPHAARPTPLASTSAILMTAMRLVIRTPPRTMRPGRAADHGRCCTPRRKPFMTTFQYFPAHPRRLSRRRNRGSCFSGPRASPSWRMLRRSCLATRRPDLPK